MLLKDYISTLNDNGNSVIGYMSGRCIEELAACGIKSFREILKEQKTSKQSTMADALFIDFVTAMNYCRHGYNVMNKYVLGPNKFLRTNSDGNVLINIGGKETYYEPTIEEVLSKYWSYEEISNNKEINDEKQ